MDAWIVGGALRDRALGRRVSEVDLAVSGDAASVARALEAHGFGRAFLLSADKSPRVFRVAGRGRILDVAEIEGGSIDTDLARRDFTVNALAFDLASGDLLDPFGGLDDLRARRLAMVSEKNLADDPLRCLRAARLAATHGLTPDRRTSVACRRAAPALARVARERIQAELAKLLEAQRALPALALGVAHRRARARARPSDPAGEVETSGARSRLDRLGAGARAARRAPAPAPTRARRRGARAPGGLRSRGGSGGSARARRRRGTWRTWSSSQRPPAPTSGTTKRGAGSFGRAIGPATRCGSSRRTRRGTGALRAAFRRGCAGKGRYPTFAGRTSSSGSGVPPGPQVGRLLEAVRVEALAGRVRTREEARKWLQAAPGSGGSAAGRVG